MLAELINRSLGRYKYTAILGIIALGVIIRFCWLEADPPLFFTRKGQALLTDPYNVVHFARNKALFGSWDIFDHHRWVVFKYSLSSVFSYLIFILMGVSRFSANFSATILSLGGIMLFTFAHKKTFVLSSLVAGLLVISSMTLIVYGRYPFLENGLIFLYALLYFLFVKYYPRDSVLILSGLLVSLCALSGKAFGIAMIGPIGLIIWLDNRQQFVRRFGLVTISFLVSTVLLLLLFYGGNLETVYSYLTEQTVGMYGTPRALTSPIGFAERLLTFGGISSLYYFSPILLLMLFFSLCFLVLSSDCVTHLNRNRALAFNIGWFISTFLLLMVFNYRPLRYQVLMILPISGIISNTLTGFYKFDSCFKLSPSKGIVLFIICWYCVVQTGIIAKTLIPGTSPDYSLVWYSVAPAVLLCVGFSAFRKRCFHIVYHKHYVFVALVLLYLATQLTWMHKWFDNKSYCLQEAGNDLAQVVSEDAVIIGPYSSALTIDNRLSSFIYMFGLSGKEPDLFDKYPITHLAIDITNWDKAIRDYPILEKSKLSSRYSVRDIDISIIRICDANIPASHYRPTSFERAMAAFYSPEWEDSTLHHLTIFLNANRTNKSGLKLLSVFHTRKGEVAKAFEVFDKLISLFPGDFFLYFDRGLLYYQIYLLSGDRSALKESNHNFELASSKNPYVDKDIADARHFVDSLHAQGELNKPIPMF